ncbi:hypothetical protein OAR97_03590 [Arcobacteraceae bacterium]|nr:hypothetical protein [Arcobacteraceae bacterium]
MFKQAKSAFIWYHLYKFRRTVVLIVLLLSVVLFSQWIYSDVVEYLTLRKKLEYLDILLPIKWVIIFFNIGLSSYLITSLFKKEKKEEVKVQSDVKKEKQKEDTIKSSTLSEREASFLYKKKLSNKADKLVNG